MNPLTDEMGVNDADIALMKKQRSREKIARFFRKWWIPVASAVGGFSAGTIVMMAHNKYNSYPYAAAIAMGAASSRVRTRSVGRLLLVSVPLMLVCFLLGLEAGDVILPGRHLPAGTFYGVTHEEAQ